jgi:acetolactate synthase-1/3 small subunit/acetolactate synthase II small subunit
MQLVIRFRPAEGAIVRILGLIERRGFILRDLTVQDEDADGSIVVDLTPREQARQLDVLARQLGRLVDVKGVSIATPMAGPYA